MSPKGGWVGSLGAAFLAVLLVLSGCSDPGEKAQEFLSEGQRLFDEEQYAAADISLRNALKLDPTLADAHYLRAKIFERNEAWPQVFRELQNVVRLDPDRVDANIELVSFYLASRNIEQAQERVDQVRAVAPEDYRLFRAQAAVDAAEGFVDTAQMNVEKALQRAPEDLESLVLYGSLLLSQRQFDEAGDILERLTTAHPADDATHSLRFRFYAAQDQVEDADVALRALIALEPGQLARRQALAAYQARTERMDAAEVTLREAIDDFPDEPRAKLALAALLGQKDADLAVETLRGFVEQESRRSTELQVALAELYARRGSLEEAGAVYEQLSAQQEDVDAALLARNKLAQLAWSQDQQDEARELVAAILADDPGNAEALVTRATIRLADRDADAAIQDLQRAHTQKPDDVRALYLLGRAFQLQGDTEQARDAYGRALQVDAFHEYSALEFARLVAQDGALERAADVLDPIVRRGRVNTATAGLLIETYLNDRNWTRAREIGALLAKRRDNQAWEQLVEAAVLRGQGDAARAAGMYEAILENNPGIGAALRGAVASYRASGNPERGIALLEQRIADSPEDQGARALLAQELLREGRRDAAESVLRAGIKAASDWIAGYAALGRVVASDDPEAEQAVYAAGLAANPEAAPLLLRMAILHQNQGRLAEAEAGYRRVLEVAPESDVAANNLAMMLASDPSDLARLAEAERIARRFARYTQVAFADTLGWVYYQQGKHSQAAEIFERAVREAPEAGVFRYHLGAALLALGDRETARRHLEKAREIYDTRGAFEGHEEALALLESLDD
jgi:tetratricopeptide (TPR) repeat protein